MTAALEVRGAEVTSVREGRQVLVMRVESGPTSGVLTALPFAHRSGA